MRTLRIPRLWQACTMEGSAKTRSGFGECLRSPRNSSSVLLFKQYNSWCAENGLQSDGQKTFYAHVRTFSAAITEGKVNADGSRVNGFRGIALKQTDDAHTGGKQGE